MNNRKAVHSQGRQIIYNVYQFMKIEKEEGLTTPLSQLREHVAEATVQLEEEVEEKTIVHILTGQFEEKVQNEVKIVDTKKFNELVRILEAHNQCEKYRERDGGNKYKKYFVEDNKEDAEPKKNVSNEMNINNVNIGRDVENDNTYERNGIKE
ncbi:hypothetical protein FQA39_LY07502 [Lamprigera yunnana]|nr:hypothetical protein FQA39_LY07502 [Lamprigera yunnana]